MRFLSVATSAFIVSIATSARAALPAGCVCYSPGNCICSGADSNNFSYTPSANLPNTPAVNTNVHVYIIWYNNAGTPWVLADQQRIANGFFGNLTPSSWWKALSGPYPNNPDKGADNSGSTISLANCFSGSPPHCVTDPENEGTNNLDSSLQTIVDNNVTPTGSLPSDPNGLYIVLPSTNDITNTSQGLNGTCSVGTGGGTSVAHCMLALREFCTPGPCTGACQWSFLTTPSGNCQLDVQVQFMSAEMAGSITAWDQGWLGTFTGGQVHEACHLSIMHSFTVPGGAVANWTAQVGPPRYDFLLYPFWQNSQGGVCETQSPPAYWPFECNVNADCPAYSGVCSSTQPGARCTKASCGAHCIAPTCLDGVANGAETDVDCGGGGDCNPCASGKHCSTGADCLSSSSCVGGVCT